MHQFPLLFLYFPIEIIISALGLKFCAITAVIKKYNLTIKKKEKKHDEIVFLTKAKLNEEVLISKALND